MMRAGLSHRRVIIIGRGQAGLGVAAAFIRKGLHSSEFLYPRQIPTNDALIVGGGNGGVQLARELVVSRSVTLAVRTPRRHGPVSHYPRSSRFWRLFASGDDWLPDQATARSPQRTMTGLPGLVVAGMTRYGGTDAIAGIWRDQHHRPARHRPSVRKQEP